LFVHLDFSLFFHTLNPGVMLSFDFGNGFFRFGHCPTFVIKLNVAFFCFFFF